ncbi:hypothetical protein AB0K89_24030, partial [Streptomyces cinnamoneus]
MSRASDSSSSGPQGRGGAAYPSGTPPYGTNPGEEPTGSAASASSGKPGEPKTETTMTTRIRINIPGSRPIPPVVLRTPVGDEAAAAAPDAPAAPAAAAAPARDGGGGRAGGAARKEGLPVRPKPTAQTPAAAAGSAAAGAGGGADGSEKTSDWFAPRKSGGTPPPPASTRDRLLVRGQGVRAKKVIPSAR